MKLNKTQINAIADLVYEKVRSQVDKENNLLYEQHLKSPEAKSILRLTNRLKESLEHFTGKNHSSILRTVENELKNKATLFAKFIPFNYKQQMISHLVLQTIDVKVKSVDSMVDSLVEKFTKKLNEIN